MVPRDGGVPTPTARRAVCRAGLACAQHDLQTGRLDRATPIVLLLTGSGLKDLATVEGLDRRAPVSDLAQLPGRVRAWHGMLGREAR